MEKKEQTAPAKSEPTKPAQSETEQELKEIKLEEVVGGIGTQSTGAGAGRVTFNPFSITRKQQR